jgi:hypothetical protein
MASLTGSTIATSYEQLLSLPDGGGNTSNLVAVTDGDGGTTFCISLTDASTGKAVLAVDGSHASGTEIQIDNSAGDGDAFLSFQLSGTSLFTMGVDDGDSDKFKIGTTAIGTGTMFALDTNSRISLSNNDLGTSNTLFGKNAGANLDAGSNYNVFIGENVSDDAMDDAIYNVGVGTYALSVLTQGDNNVCIGGYAGYDITTSSDSILIGRNAGANISTGADGTIAVGKDALTALTSGASNTAVGYQAGDAVTTGHGNVFIGKTAGGATEDLGFSVIIGEEALGGGVATAAADGMVAIGKQAAYSITTAPATTAIGYFSMLQHTTGGYNTCLGYGTMQDTDAGSTSQGSAHNIFIGVNSGGGTWADAASSYNTAIGNYAMDAALDGAIYNTALGLGALTDLTTGGSNTSIGMESLYENVDGSNNVAVGYRAGEHDDEAADATSPDQCIIIGAEADFDTTTPTNEIVIGYDANGKGDNTATIGNASCTAVYMSDDSGASVHAGAVVSSGGIYSGTITVADDAVGSITPPRQGVLMSIICQANDTYPAGQQSGLFYCDTGTSLDCQSVGATNSYAQPSEFERHGSDPDGTTSTDGYSGISAQAGVIKIECRRGVSTTYFYSFIG